ncbi:alpha/beta fold hydrolase [Pseudogemmobacter sonorensis]|uniref:alpha/beta fold hydrolase n=1 Tax=Pseudogemmobacter sonorensis TaxID=2989681 RepID=UPI0036877ECA
MAEDLTAAARAPAPLPLRQWDRGGTRPVLALHCALGHSGNWSGLAERLTGLRLVAPDLPGHGLAPAWVARDSATGDYHRDATLAVADLAAQLGGGAPIDLLGHSSGATVALRLALERPDLVRSLVLIEPPFFAAARDSAEGRREAGEEAGTMALIETDPEAGAVRFHAVWGAGPRLADLPERQRRYIVERIGYVAAQGPALVEDSAGMLAPGRIESLGVPVLLVEGDESPPVIDAVQSALAARLPRARRVIVPGAGHMLPLTDPDVVARAVQSHLEEA